MENDRVVIAWPELAASTWARADLIAGRRSREGERSLERWEKRLEERWRKTACGENPGPWGEAKPLPDWRDEEEAV